jgi:glycosyltransferase involved in cell wall biosynthesis
MRNKKKLLRITTVPISLKVLLKDQLAFMNQYFDVVGVSSRGKELDEVANNEHIKTIALDMSREITPLQDIVSLIKMILLLLREKPHIVHTHTPKAGIVGMLASWICMVPNRFHTVAGLPVMEATGNKKKLLHIVEKITYICATKIYPNSKGLATYILENKLSNQEKLKVIGFGSSNGIDTEYFKPTHDIDNKAQLIKNQYSLNDKFIFCFVGRIVKDKGIDELVYAFDNISKNNINARLLIVGEFEDFLDPISNQSKKILNQNNAIIFVGFQNDIRPYLVCSDCFVFPTYREGFPNVILQACSMELPCIVTNINGCNEIIRDNINGLIIEPKDSNALRLAMEKVLIDKVLIDKLSKNTREDIVKKYDRKQFFNYLLAEYMEVTNV